MTTNEIRLDRLAREQRAKYDKLTWSLFLWGVGIATGFLIGRLG